MTVAVRDGRALPLSAPIIHKAIPWPDTEIARLHARQADLQTWIDNAYHELDDIGAALTGLDKRRTERDARRAVFEAWLAGNRVRLHGREWLL